MELSGGGPCPPAAYGSQTPSSPRLIPRHQIMGLGKSRRSEETRAEIVDTQPVSPLEPEDLEVPEQLFDGEAGSIPEEKDFLLGVPDEDDVVLAPVKAVTIPEDASDDLRLELAKILNAEIGLKERAKLLVKIAHMTDTKRAPVALRALQEINLLTGISKDRPTDSAPMFQLPEGVAVSIKVEKPVK